MTNEDIIKLIDGKKAQLRELEKEHTVTNRQFISRKESLKSQIKMFEDILKK